MDKVYEERKFKIDRIIEEYDKRKTQIEVADLFRMDINEVAFVTKDHNYTHTRKITPDNRKNGELINLIIVLDDYKFLDKYPIENFMK